MVPRPLGSLAASWELVPKSVQSIRPPACFSSGQGPAESGSPCERRPDLANQRLSQSCWLGIPGPTRWRYSPPATHLPGYPALPLPTSTPLAGSAHLRGKHSLGHRNIFPSPTAGGLVVVVTWGHSVPCLSVFLGLLSSCCHWEWAEPFLTPGVEQHCREGPWANEDNHAGFSMPCDTQSTWNSQPQPTSTGRLRPWGGGGEQTYVLRVTSASRFCFWIFFSLSHFGTCVHCPRSAPNSGPCLSFHQKTKPSMKDLCVVRQGLLRPSRFRLQQYKQLWNELLILNNLLRGCPHLWRVLNWLQITSSC